MPKNHYPKQGRNMHYKLIVTDEMEKLLNKHIEYLLNKFKSKQAASHLLDSLESLYNHLKTIHFFIVKVKTQSIISIIEKQNSPD